MFWLTWKLFGNGYGLGSPYWDDVFYWLGGRFYHWTGGFGAQLHSYEWAAPKAGTRRRLFGEPFVVFQTRRKFLLVEVSWAHVPVVRDAEEIRTFHAKLMNWGHGL